MIGRQVISNRYLQHSAVNIFHTYSKQLVVKTHIYRLSSSVSNDENKRILLNKILQTYPSVYNSSEVEKNWYEWWQNSGYFRSQASENAKVFSMILPPPNITGTLHLGHALTVTVQDVLIRWYRMRGITIELILFYVTFCRIKLSFH